MLSYKCFKFFLTLTTFLFPLPQCSCVSLTQCPPRHLVITIACFQSILAHAGLSMEEADKTKELPGQKGQRSLGLIECHSKKTEPLASRIVWDLWDERTTLCMFEIGKKRADELVPNRARRDYRYSTWEGVVCYLHRTPKLKNKEIVTG